MDGHMVASIMSLYLSSIHEIDSGISKLMKMDGLVVGTNANSCFETFL